jgi:hypothetical protein
MPEAMVTGCVTETPEPERHWHLSRLGRALKRRSRQVWATVGVVAGVAASIAGGVVAGITTGDEARGALCAGVTSDQFAIPSGDDPVTKFAPLVFLHPKESLFPVSATCYLQNSALVFTSPRGARKFLVPQGQIDATKLGFGTEGSSERYAVDVAGDPCEGDDCVMSTHFTRPYQGRHFGSPGRSGFHLNADERLEAGSRSVIEGPIFAGTPAYYEIDEENSFITYWLFYGFSSPGALLTGNISHPITHEGDWESISVHFENGVPTEVAYFAHGAPIIVAWANVPKLDTHPIVFSARRSHASYMSAGPARRELLRRALSSQLKNADETKVGLLWPTWNMLVNARTEPWYGFGGAWGDIGSTNLGTRLAKERTGPLGPSTYKCAAPGQWLPPETDCQAGLPFVPERP